jgi:hypothetical protein
MTTYFDFSRIADTFSNATNEVVDAFVTDGPTWIGAMVLIAVMGVIVYVVGKAGGFIGDILDAKKIFNKK